MPWEIFYMIIWTAILRHIEPFCFIFMKNTSFPHYVCLYIYVCNDSFTFLLYKLLIQYLSLLVKGPGDEDLAGGVTVNNEPMDGGSEFLWTV